MNRSSRTLLAATALALCAASPAAADSIAYVKGGDLYLAPTDFSREYRVTSTGGYSTVSQADDGTLVATAGTHLRTLDRTGKVLSDVDTPMGSNGGSYMTFKGPFDADVSPDGTKAAYGFVHSGLATDGAGNVYDDTSNATAFTRLTSATSITEAGYRYSNEYDAPEWIDNATVLVSNGPGYPSDPIAIAPAGSGDSKSWFTDPAAPHPMDATISRDKRVIATVGGPERTSLHVYRDEDAQLLGTVYDCFTYTPDVAGRQFASPTFNADGTLLVWANGAGLEVAPVGDMASACAPGQGSREVVPGGSNPDWGPADVPADRAVDPVPTPTPVPTVDPGEQAPPTPLAVKAVKVKLRTAVRKGVTLKVTAPAAGKLTASGRVGGKVVARGTATAKAAGPLTLKLKFTAAGRKRLTKAHAAKVEVTVTQAGASKALTVKLGR